MFYLNKTGTPWRYLPKGAQGFPPWQSVSYHVRHGISLGLWERLNDALRRAGRVQAGRDPSPSAALIDSQAVKSSYAGGVRGFDGGKRLKGRQRHIVTDTLGLLVAVRVPSAGLPERQQAPPRLKRLLGKVPRLQVIFADQGYQRTPAGLFWRYFAWLGQVVHHGRRGVVVLKKRGIVERRFSWFGRSRRLSKNYEYLPEVSEAMVQLGSIRVRIRRLA